MEGFQEYQLPLTVTFVDFKKAFDSINRTVTVNAIKVLYSNSSSAVMVDGIVSEPFDVTTGVLQGDVLAPFLFIIFVDYLLCKASGPDCGAVTCPRRSRRYPAKMLNDLLTTSSSWNPQCRGPNPSSPELLMPLQSLVLLSVHPKQSL